MLAKLRGTAEAALPVLLALAVISTVLAAVFLLPDHLVHKDLVPDGPLRIKLRNDARSTLLQGIGGLLVLVGAYITWRQVQIGRDQLQHNLEMSRHELDLNRQVHLTQRFSDAIEYLGNPRSDIQLGGIYTLETVAHHSASDRSTVAQVLAAYVRRHHDRHSLNDSWRGSEAPPPDQTVTKAVLLVLGGSRVRFDELPTPLDLAETDLQEAQLPALHLRGANLSGSHLSNSNLSSTHLDGADLSDADLQTANLCGGHLDGCNLTRANLQTADLRNADLTGATLVDANLLQNLAEWSDNHAVDEVLVPQGIDDAAACHLVRRVSVGADLRNAVLKDAHLIGADLESTLLQDASLQRARLDQPISS
jgi:uncharacterized protein YjbI with pentapeptide repeats